MSEENKRVAPRHRTLKAGKIVLAKSGGVVDCTVRDISDTGAKLLCGDQAAVPNEFQIYLPGDRTIRDARVVWRRDMMLGIIFIGEAKPAPLRRY